MKYKKPTAGNMSKQQEYATTGYMMYPGAAAATGQAYQSPPQAQLQQQYQPQYQPQSYAAQAQYQPQQYAQTLQQLQRQQQQLLQPQAQPQAQSQAQPQPQSQLSTESEQLQAAYLAYQQQQQLYAQQQYQQQQYQQQLLNQLYQQQPQTTPATYAHAPQGAAQRTSQQQQPNFYTANQFASYLTRQQEQVLNGQRKEMEQEYRTRLSAPSTAAAVGSTAAAYTTAATPLGTTEKLLGVQYSPSDKVSHVKFSSGNLAYNF